MDFQAALVALKNGYRITRAAWTDANRWLSLDAGTITVTESGTAGVGSWSPTQADILADDWSWQ